MENALFEIDDEGWIAQNRGRNLWEVFRELLQNAMDEDTSQIVVEADSRRKQVSVADDGNGFRNIRDAWSVFGGDKGGDPTKRGRFGRGVKEAIASAKWAKLETTGGVVTWDLEARERTVDESVGREKGTKITVRNDEWLQRDIREVYNYVKKVWPPEGVKIVVRVKGGNEYVGTRKDGWSPEFTFKRSLTTVQLNEEKGEMEETRRMAEIHVKRGEGRLYEMGIPVDLDAPFPFMVDVQQKVPMAEQRNEPDNWWYERELQKVLVDALWGFDGFESLTDKDMRADWFVEALSRGYDNEPKEAWVARVIADGRKKGVVTSSDEFSDDKAEQHGHQVYDTSRAGEAAGSIVNAVCDSSASVAQEIAEQERFMVTSVTPEQEEFIELAETIADIAGYPDVEFQLWHWEPTPRANHTAAEYADGVVRLNTHVHQWDSATAEYLGVVMHELAHAEGIGHNQNWYHELQRIAGAVVVELMPR